MIMLDIHKLKIKDSIQGKVLIAEKHLHLTREGKPYLRLRLINRTGSIEGILWEDAEAAANQLSQGQVVNIKGVVVLYQQELRLRLNSLSPVPEHVANKREFLPSSPRDLEEMTDEFHQTIRKVKNPFLKHLLESIFRDPEIWKIFSNAPAAKAMHHAYLGGLLEHSLSVARLVQQISKIYPFLNHDLILTAALIHDLGKGWELSPELGFEYTDKGRLLGHIIIGLDIIEKKITQIPEFPLSLSLQLKHLITSHHGKLEFGSPKSPATLEAICLHMLDDLDAKLCGVHEYIQKEASINDAWTAFHRIHQQYFYIPESLPNNEKVSKPSKKEEDDNPPTLFS